MTEELTAQARAEAEGNGRAVWLNRALLAESRLTEATALLVTVKEKLDETRWNPDGSMSEWARSIEGRTFALVSECRTALAAFLSATPATAAPTYEEACRLCDKPPAGWNCTRELDHDGPCAAWPAPAVPCPDWPSQDCIMLGCDGSASAAESELFPRITDEYPAIIAGQTVHAPADDDELEALRRSVVVYRGVLDTYEFRIAELEREMQREKDRRVEHTAQNRSLNEALQGAHKYERKIEARIARAVTELEQSGYSADPDIRDALSILKGNAK